MMTKRTGFGFALLLWGVLLVAVDGKDLPSVCVCECCRWTGLEKMQCADPGLTAFEVDHCSSCNVRACARQFDVDCPERGSKVKSYCVHRSSWKQKFVPIGFVFVTLSLVLYGMLTKKRG